MGMFRSEDIEIYKLNIHKDSDWKIMNELGKMNQLHFIDLNRETPRFNLAYTQQIKKLEETERKLT